MCGAQATEKEMEDAPEALPVPSLETLAATVVVRQVLTQSGAAETFRRELIPLVPQIGRVGKHLYHNDVIRFTVRRKGERRLSDPIDLSYARLPYFVQKFVAATWRLKSIEVGDWLGDVESIVYDAVSTHLYSKPMSDVVWIARKCGFSHSLDDAWCNEDRWGCPRLDPHADEPSAAEEEEYVSLLSIELFAMLEHFVATQLVPVVFPGAEVDLMLEVSSPPFAEGEYTKALKRAIRASHDDDSRPLFQRTPVFSILVSV